MPVVKSKEYKSVSRLHDKVHYVFTQKFEGTEEQVAQRRAEIEPFLFTMYNGSMDIEQTDIDGISADMHEQVAHINRRKDGTYYAENFINFSGKDFNFTNHNEEYVAQMKYTMADMTRTWIELRGISETTWVARPHFDTDNPHIHVLFTKNKRDEKKRVHLTRAALRNAQNKLNEYQQEQHPHLQHTFKEKIQSQKRQRYQQRDTKLIMERHGKKPTKKQAIQRKLESALPLAKSMKSIAIAAKNKGYEVYERGGVPYGVVLDGKHYRFTTLMKGTAHEERVKLMMENARELAKAKRRLERVKKQKQRNRDRSKGFDRSR